MVKKKAVLLTVVACTGNTASRVLSDVIYKSIALKENALRFLHLELKGNTWVLLDALDSQISIPDPTILTFERGGKFPIMRLATEKLEVSIFTVIQLPGEQFWHLDQLPDGKWRITMADDMPFPPHEWMTEIKIRTARDPVPAE